MSLRLEMLQVARLARNLLHDASDLVREFLLGELTEDGGFRDRAGQPDLYYTVFGLESLLALQADLPHDRVARFVRSFGDGSTLGDLVEIGSLVRCDAALDRSVLSPETRQALVDRLPLYRSGDGGFANVPGRDLGTIYACFVALGIYQDLGLEYPDRETIRSFIESMETPDGGYANESSLPVGTTPAACAAATLLRNLGYAPRSETSDLAARSVVPERGRVSSDAPNSDARSALDGDHAPHPRWARDRARVRSRIVHRFRRYSLDELGCRSTGTGPSRTSTRSTRSTDSSPSGT